MDVYSVPAVYKVEQDRSDLRIDKEQLNFHITTGDYFGVQATALGFVEEYLSKCESMIGSSKHSKELVLLRLLRAEAIHLHQNRYTINPSDSM